MREDLRHYLEELDQFRRRVEELYEQAVVGPRQAASGERRPGTWEPAADVVESEEEWIYLIELPGVRRDAIELQAADGELVLAGRREPPSGTVSFHRMERTHGPFRRALPLPEDAETEEIEARFRLGVLEIHVPRRPTARQVAIESEEGGET